MKRKNADELLTEVIYLMRGENDSGKRYDYYTVAESLLTEYRDLKYNKTKEKIDGIKNKPIKGKEEVIAPLASKDTNPDGASYGRVS